MGPRADAVPVAVLMLLAGCFQSQAPPSAAPGIAAKAPGDSLQRVVALADEADERSLPALVGILNDDTDPAVRREAVYAIAEIGGEADAATVAQALRDPDTSVRMAAIDVLSTMDGELPAGLLADALNDVNPQLRLRAVDAFGDIDGPTASLALQQALADPDAVVRETAAELLAERAGGSE